MSGFSPALMQSMMTANTALNAAQANTRAISQMQCQKQTLEAEIRSGHGDIEGKQAEIERIDAQTVRAEQMQQKALDSANSGLNSSLAAAEDPEETRDAGGEEKETPGAQAREKADALRAKLQDHDIAALDYSKGMHIESPDGKTSVAIAPQFLCKMAADESVDAQYMGHLATMRALDGQQIPGQIVSSGWSIEKDGTISRSATVPAEAGADKVASVRTALTEEGRAAFGSLFSVTHVSRAGTASAADPAAAGMLIDKNI